MRPLVLVLGIALGARAQQPFLTDDADVTEVRHHLELLTEHDVLQSGAYPAFRQNTTRLQVTYGLMNRLEIGFDDPLLFIYNDRTTGIGNALGLGDLDLQMKYNVRRWARPQLQTQLGAKYTLRKSLRLDSQLRVADSKGAPE